jgi:flagellar basal-body rod protein FlgB
MFIDRMMNQGAAPVIEEVLKFTSARQRLLAEDVANISTPNYVQKDMSPAQFQKLLREKIAAADGAGEGAERGESPRGESFGDISVDVENPKSGILFHDGNNRSVEELMSSGMKNGLTHNLMIELLKRQFTTMELALSAKP